MRIRRTKAKNYLQELKYSADNSVSLITTPLLTTQPSIMRTLLQKLLNLLIGASFVFSLLVVPIKAKAETISVSPPKFELFGNPGDIVNEKLKVRNDSGSELTYKMLVEDFQAGDEEGGVLFVEDPDAPKTNFSLANWVTVEPSQFTVPANGERVINVNIRIPRDAEPGGHYASVQIRLAGDQVVGGGASVESRLNSLILLRVSGNVTEKVVLEEFKPADTWQQFGPIDFTLKSRNEGNVHVAPTGTIIVTDTFNRKVQEIPLRVANVLPGSSRAIKTTWDRKNLIGRYTATLVANYGQNQEPLTATTTFYVIPLTLVWIVLGLIIIIVLLITQRKTLKRALNRLTSD